MIKAGIQNSINEHQEKLDNLRDSYCKLKYQEKQLLTQCQDTKDAPICKDGYTYFKLPDMHHQQLYRELRMNMHLRYYLKLLLLLKIHSIPFP